MVWMFARRAGAVAGFFLLLHSFACAATDLAKPSPPGRLVDVGGYQVHLYCTGTGSPTVMVVGGAFSFDWGLVQPEVAKFTRICTYDPSGTAWSDPYRSPSQKGQEPAPSCVERVTELHRLLQNAGISGPYVLVGFSIGGLIGRLYALNYPEEVAGMVIVDHAFIDVGSNTPVSSNSQPGNPAGSTAASSVDSPPVLISSSPITLGLEDDQNFSRLPQRDRDLHTWAMSIHPLRPTAEMATECSATVESATKDQAYPFDHRPLIIIRTNDDRSAYAKLQAKLLALSHNSKQVTAEKSSHMVIIDEPEMVTAGIREVVNAVRNGTKLTEN